MARVLRIGLTGGIASGKSTVAARLAQLGAVVVDADRLSREVVAPGTPGLAAVAAEFGPGVIGADGGLDRAAMGRLVFADAGARMRLEEIVHPLVRVAGEELEAAAPDGAVVVHDIPLLAEKGYAPRFHAVLVAEAALDERVGRMVHGRGMTEAEARARIAAQAGDEDRRRVADVVLPAGRTVRERLAEVDGLWTGRLAPWARNIVAGTAVRRRSPVELYEHDPAWRHTAARQLHRLRYALDAAGLEHDVLGLDHIGSTAVPGLVAKPVIDLQVRARSWDVVTGELLARALGEAAFVAAGERTDDVHATLCPDERDWRKLLWRGTDPYQVYHLHVRVHGAPGARLTLLVRDWLRAVPEAREGYTAATIRAASAAPGGTEAARGEHPAAKAPWFTEHVPDAVAWGRDSGWRGPGPG